MDKQENNYKICDWTIVRRKGSRVRYQCRVHLVMDPWEPMEENGENTDNA